jgi:hypothetical protein
MYKKFEKDDIIHNVLITNPKITFKIFRGNIYSNLDIVAKSQEVVTPGTYEAKLDFSDDNNSQYIPLI